MNMRKVGPYYAHAKLSKSEWPRPPILYTDQNTYILSKNVMRTVFFNFPWHPGSISSFINAKLRKYLSAMARIQDTRFNTSLEYLTTEERKLSYA